MEEKSKENVFTLTSKGGTYKIVLPDSKTDYIQQVISSTELPYEKDLLDFTLGFLRKGDTVLDVGGNIGNHSAFWAAHGMKIHYFEPDSHLVDAFRETIEVNSFDFEPTVWEIALGEAYSKGIINNSSQDNLGANRVLQASNGAVEIRRLDDLGIANVQLLKIDVEGMELPVLKGATSLIEQERPILIVETLDEESFGQLEEFAQDYSYLFIAIFNASPTHFMVPVEKANREVLNLGLNGEASKTFRSYLRNQETARSLRDANDKYRDAMNQIKSLKMQLEKFNQSEIGPDEHSVERNRLSKIAPNPAELATSVDSLQLLKEILAKLNKNEHGYDTFIGGELGTELARTRLDLKSKENELSMLNDEISKLQRENENFKNVNRDSAAKISSLGDALKRLKLKLVSAEHENTMLLQELSKAEQQYFEKSIGLEELKKTDKERILELHELRLRAAKVEALEFENCELQLQNDELMKTMHEKAENLSDEKYREESQTMKIALESLRVERLQSAKALVERSQQVGDLKQQLAFQQMEGRKFEKELEITREELGTAQKQIANLSRTEYQLKVERSILEGLANQRWLKLGVLRNELQVQESRIKSAFQESEEKIDGLQNVLTKETGMKVRHEKKIQHLMESLAKSEREAKEVKNQNSSLTKTLNNLRGSKSYRLARALSESAKNPLKLLTVPRVLFESKKTEAVHTRAIGPSQPKK